MRRPKHVVLRVVSVSVFLLSVTCARPAPDSVERAFRLQQVGPNAWAAIDNWQAKAPASANAGFVIGDDGVAVIDTLGNEDAARQLLAEIRRLTELPVKFVINTHYHLDHVAGNRVFVDAGAVVLAHRNVRNWIRTENLRLLGKDLTPQWKTTIEAFLAPHVVYQEAMSLYLGSREIRLLSLPGHTGGDSVVVVPDAKVAFAGDLFWRNIVPNMMDGSTKPWIDTLDILVKSNAAHTFVSGHGEVGNAEDVAAFRGYLETLLTLVTAAQAQGRSGNALLDAVLPALAERYGQWDFFKGLAERSITDMDAELSGKKRIPEAR